MLSWLKWLYPGMKVKRWLLLAFVGLLLTVAGLSVLNDAVLLGLLLKTVVRLTYSYWGSSFSWWTGLALALLGVTLIVVGFKEVMRSLFNTLLPENAERLVEIIYQRRSLQKGPRIAAIGGGTGLPNLLRGLKNYTSNLTAIVTVADDGGSSGRLRGELGVLPPGDTRNCLVALADTETLMDEVLNYRFDQGEGLSGHSLGNLILAGLTEVTGNLDLAIREMSKILALRGKVLPSTLQHAILCAEYEDGTIIQGESKIPVAGRSIKRVFLQPADCAALPEAILAIKEADVVVLGPGSLYTSIIPNLLVKDLAQALRDTQAPVIYICNIMTQSGETDNYTASDHLKALVRHLGSNVIDYMVVNTGMVPAALLQRYRQEGAKPVSVDKRAVEKLGTALLGERVINTTDVIRHDPDRLARLIIRQSLHKRKRIVKQPRGK